MLFYTQLLHSTVSAFRPHQESRRPSRRALPRPGGRVSAPVAVLLHCGGWPSARLTRGWSTKNAPRLRVLVQEGDGVASRLGRKPHVVTLPKEETLLAARDGVEEPVHAGDRERLVLGHVQKQNLRMCQLRGDRKKAILHD